MENKYQLPADFARRWVEALRSGEYEQGEGKLYDADSNCYCCLGVAAKAVCNVPLAKLKHYDLLESAGGFYKYGIPEILIERSGNQNDQLINFLVQHNDGFQSIRINPNGVKLSFPEIADWIEANVEFVEGEVSHA